MKKCNKCNLDYSNDINFCKKCGSVLEQFETNAEKELSLPSQKKKNKSLGILGYIFGILIVLGSIMDFIELKFYGLFLGMDNKSVMAFGSVTLNYIFLIWCTATFSGINIVYGLITLVFVLLADILVKDYKRIPIDILFTLINCLCIFVTSIVYNYLTDEYTSIFLLIVFLQEKIFQPI